MEMNDKLTIDESGSSALEDIAKDDFVDVPSGLYIYQILENEVVLGVGKWVVEH